MLFSKSFIFTSKEDPKAAECRSHKFLLKGCFLFMVSSGIYSYLPLGWRVLGKISNIIRKHMNASGAQELLMSALQPMEIWQKTGRDKDLSDVMLKFEDRKERLLCLGPTHEEEITEIVRRYVNSYKQLPFNLYQIQTKFRDEPRPRFGLMRSCEFIMKDAYSFDADEQGLNESYEKMFTAYNEIFKECGLRFVAMEAETGAMGGNFSHEFMVPAEIGEDVLSYCDKCGKYFRQGKNCSQCDGGLIEKKMIEIGHIFKLGTKYSIAQEAFFLDSHGSQKAFIMGCYGIGVSRILAAVAETSCDDKGIIWPRSLSPFDISLILLEDGLLQDAISLKNVLEKSGVSVLLDERKVQGGVKFNDAYLIGNPYLLVMGKNYLNSQKIEVEIRKTREKLNFSRDELINFLLSKDT